MFVTVILWTFFPNFSLEHFYTVRYKSNTVVRVEICVTSWKHAKNSDAHNKKKMNKQKNEIMEMFNLLNIKQCFGSNADRNMQEGY